jgi:hypothetical protein
VIRTLQKDDEEQQSHFSYPDPTSLPFNQLENQNREPGKEKESSPGGMTYREMCKNVSVKVKEEKKDYEGEW